MTKFLSIDIGGTSIKFALINSEGKIIEKNKVKTPTNRSDFLKQIDLIINKYNDQINGVAFCSPGKVKNNLIQFGGSLPFLNGLDFSKIYPNRAWPTAVINDGKSAVLAENWLGSLKDEENCAAIILGTAVGSGIIINGHLLDGVHAQAGELSFMISDSSMAKNMAGNVGSLASAVKMVKTINNIDNYFDLTDGMHAFELIKKDRKAEKIFHQYCLQIAIVILNLQSVVDVNKIAIGGGISSQEVLILGIKDAYRELVDSLNPLIGQTLTTPKIVEAKFKNDANLYGALYNLLLQINHENVYTA